MENHAANIDIITVNIEQVNQLLYCFEDFCDHEGRIDQRESLGKQKIAALTFTERLEYYRSLLYAAHLLLSKSFRDLTQIADEIAKSGMGQAD